MGTEPSRDEDATAAEPSSESRRFVQVLDLAPEIEEEVIRAGALREGQVLGRLRVLRQLAVGGMGAVYRAEEIDGGRIVALKILLGRHCQESRQRFRAEARLLRRLHHPHIARIHDIGMAGGFDFLTMEYVDGCTWDRYLATEDPGPREIAAKLADVAEATQFAHDLGVIHRDIKPGNLMVDRQGRIVLMDFGTARDLHSPDRLTMASRTIGTPPYMAPEQAMNQGGLIGPATDVWGLGAVLYESLTGQLPFVGESIYDTFRAIVEHQPPRPSQLRPELPRELDLLVMACLQKEPRQRYASAKDLAEDLRRIAAGQQPQHRSTRLHQWAPIARRWLPLTLLLALALSSLLRLDTLTAALGFTTALAAGIWAWHERQRHRQADQHLRSFRAAMDALRERVDDEQRRSWRLLHRAVFVPEALRRDWDCVNGLTETRDGVLVRANGIPMYTWLRRPVFGDQRIELRVVQPGPKLNDVTVLFRCQPDDDQESGYQLKLGCYDNTLCLLIRRGKRLWAEKRSPLAPGQELHVELEIVGGRIRAWLDEELLFDVEDPDPLTGGRFGMLGWVAETRFHSIDIYTLAQPRRPDVIDLAEHHLYQAHFQTCLDLVEGLDLQQETPSRRHRIAETRRLAQRQLSRATELEGMRQRILATWPGASVRIRGEALSVDLMGCQDRVTGLEPLVGMPVADLWCSGPGIRSLAPLRNLPLRSLMLSDAPIVDLSDLHGTTIAWLRLIRCPIVDLAPLAGVLLTGLELDGLPVTDLGPLADLPLSFAFLEGLDGVTTLDPLARCPVQQLTAQLAGIRHLPRFERGCIAHATIGGGMAALDRLEGHPLRTLTLHAAAVTSLDSIAASPLEMLVLDGCGVRRLPTTWERRLTSMRLINNPLADLATLSADDLLSLDMERSPIEDCRHLPEHPPQQAVFGGSGGIDPCWEPLLAAWISDQAGPDERRRALRRQVEVARAIASNDHGALRGLAAGDPPRHLLRVPLTLSLAEAEACARAAGARLAQPRDNEALAQIIAAIGRERVWIGLTRDADGFRLADGTAVELLALMPTYMPLASSPAWTMFSDSLMGTRPDDRHQPLLEFT